MKKAQENYKPNPRNTGKKHSEETLEKMRQVKLGKSRSEATKEKLREANLGKKRGPTSPETRAAISAAKKGKPASPAMQAVFEQMRGVPTGRIPWNKGKEIGPLSEEHRQKIGQATRGHSMSPEGRASVSAARKGKVFTADHKQLLSEAAKQRWARDDMPAFRSKTEIRVGWLLEPFGFQPQFRINGYPHPYDYGHAERHIVIEVNGCFWHAHGCGTKMVQNDTPERDKHHILEADARGYQLVTLWQCEEKEWPIILRQQGVL